MGLYERIMAFEEPRLDLHLFFACMQERALGNTAAVTAKDFFALDATATPEAVTLLNKILEPATVIEKWRRALEFENVCILARRRYPDFDTVTKLKARLGV